MPRVVPSQVVNFIGPNPLPLIRPGVVTMNTLDSAVLSGVLVLVDQIPDELITMDSDTYQLLIFAKEKIKDILATRDANRIAGQPLPRLEFTASESPLAIIRDALAKCPDESPAPATSELKFIADTDLRTNLRNDIGAVTRALSNGEWKAATVLAGSAIAALLLWSLSQRPLAEITKATIALTKSGELTRLPDPKLERWDLHEYTEVAANLGIIKSDTTTETRLAREFRNLIHPGRA